MKPYHLKIRWICEICCNFEDKDFYFNTLFSAKRCLSQALLHLNFDVAFLYFEDVVLIKIDQKGGINNETQKS